jgi:hypothetical protein
MVSQPSRQEGVCDHCGGRLYRREDDSPESITVRLEAYTRSTAPLIQFYKDCGLLVSIAADGSPYEIFERTISALESIVVLPERSLSPGKGQTPRRTDGSENLAQLEGV